MQKKITSLTKYNYQCEIISALMIHISRKYPFNLCKYYYCPPHPFNLCKFQPLYCIYLSNLMYIYYIYIYIARFAPLMCNNLISAQCCIQVISESILHYPHFYYFLNIRTCALRLSLTTKSGF